MILSNCKCIDMQKGDTGNLVFSGLPKDKNYSVYFSIFEPRTQEIKKEFLCDEYIQAEGKAVLTISKVKSDTLPVGRFEWALKLCADGMADTIVPEVKQENGVYFRVGAPTINIGAKLAEGSN